MKKILFLLIAALLALNLIACGNDPAVPTEAADSSAADAIQALDPGEFYFDYKGVRINLNNNTRDILASLGEAKGCTEEPSSIFSGMDKSYDYGSFFIDTYPVGGNDFIYGFRFVEEGPVTPEGIGIGSGQDDVAAAYGADSFDGMSTYTVEKGHGVMTILVADGVVSSVEVSLTVGN